MSARRLIMILKQVAEPVVTEAKTKVKTVVESASNKMKSWTTGKPTVGKGGGKTVGEKTVGEGGGKSVGEKTVGEGGGKTVGEKTVGEGGGKSVGGKTVGEGGGKTVGEKTVGEGGGKTVGEGGGKTVGEGGVKINRKHVTVGVTAELINATAPPAAEDEQASKFVPSPTLILFGAALANAIFRTVMSSYYDRGNVPPAGGVDGPQAVADPEE